MSKPIQRIDDTARLIDWIRPRIQKALDTNSLWAGIGYPNGSGSGRSSGTSDPTQRFALQVLEGRVDLFAKAHADVIADIQTMELAARRVEKFIQSTDSIALTAGSTPEGCKPCSQVKDQETGALHERGYQPVRERRVLPSQPNGAKVPLCKWHCDFLDRYEVEPDPALTLWHLDHRGANVPYDMIRDHHPDEFSMAQSRMRGRSLGRQNLGLRSA